MREVSVKSVGNYLISLYIYETEKEPVGSVLLIHGMAEYHQRYMPFIQYLNNLGIDVYAYDHRGHGRKCKDEDLGFFAKKNGSELVIEDAVAAMKYVYEKKRTEKCGLFSHSMGSLIGRNVIQRFDKMDCALFSGTGYSASGATRMGIFASGVVKTLCGARHRSPLLNKLMFENAVYLKNCKRTKSDWLTKDEKIVDAYLADKYCGFLCTASFYNDLVTISGKARWGMDKTRKNLPIFIASGSEDPVGNNGKDIKKLYEDYNKLGFTNVSLKLYENDRHELLNELDKDQVMKDFGDFYLKNFA